MGRCNTKQVDSPGTKKTFIEGRIIVIGNEYGEGEGDLNELIIFQKLSKSFVCNLKYERIIGVEVYERDFVRAAC